MGKPYTRTLLFCLLFLSGFSLSAQELSGWVVDEAEKVRLSNVHVINKRTLKGTLTNDEGHFSIKLNWGDTIVFSNIAYQYFYFIYADSATALSDVLIKMEEQNYLLNEVSIFSYQLTSNKDRAIELNKPLNPQASDLEDQDGRIIKAGPQNPVEFLYNLFGSKPRQLRMLAQLKAEDAYRKKLEENNNREIVVALTGLSLEELEAFMFYCKYSSIRMRSMNDYEFLRSVQRCYAEYVRESELENFLEQFD